MPEVVHVPPGTMRIASRPAVLATVVVSGYAVTWRHRTDVAGGLLHVPVSLSGPRADHLLAAPVSSFLDAIARAGHPLFGTRSEIVGGADVLRLVPTTLRGVAQRHDVAVIGGALQERGVRLTRVMVGGELGRTVRVDLSARSCLVERVMPRRPRTDTVGPGEPAAAARLVNVDMGTMAVERSGARLTAVLGSCVGIAVFDARSGVGGLAHTMLPKREGQSEAPAKYADSAVPALVAALGAAGARTDALCAHLVGGAHLLQNPGGRLADIPRRNVEAAREALRVAGIQLLSEDVGGTNGRRMVFDLRTLGVQVRTIGALLQAREATSACR